MTVTLAQVEQETARRLGPYYRLPMDRQVPSTASFQRAYFPGLRSTVEQDLATNLFLLRRGVDWQGNAVTVSDDDRQRTVANYDPAQGMVEVDRPWSVSPQSGEVAEFHHLDPEQELRPVVLGGLRRCWFEDRFSLGPGYVYEADLTAELPWLANPRDILNVELGPWPYGYESPHSMPFTTFTQSGHVCIRLNVGWSGPFWGGILLTLRRSHVSFVNGLDSTSGPTADDDTLEVDLDYAASAGHIEAWHQAPARMQAAAAGGLQATQTMAAVEFSRQARIHWPQRPDLWGLSSLFSPAEGSLTVVNA